MYPTLLPKYTKHNQTNVLHCKLPAKNISKVYKLNFQTYNLFSDIKLSAKKSLR